MVALSEMIENAVSAQAISQYETGKSSPSPDVFRSLAAAVHLPEPFFLREEVERDDGTVFFRSMSTATKGARLRAARRYEWLREIVAYLGEFVDFPESNFPILNLPEDPLLLSDDEIEESAQHARDHWSLGVGPIANMVLLLENQGCIVARDTLGAETLEGLSRFVAPERRPYMIIGTDKGTPARWRFDAAHELGHLLLHAHVPPSLVAQQKYHKVIEQQAHRFAASFLLPLAPFGDDFFSTSLDTLVALKPKWKVSVAMMITRARHAGFISEETTRRLWINYSRRGWKKSKDEPYDDTMEPEEPRLLRRAFELILENGAQTADDVTTRLALPLFDVEALCGLPNGYLENFSPVILRGGSRPSTHDERATPADVIALPFRPRTS